MLERKSQIMESIPFDTNANPISTLGVEMLQKAPLCLPMHFPPENVPSQFPMLMGDLADLAMSSKTRIA